MEGAVEFRLLGPLEVRAGDVPLPLGGRKQRAVLARLLLDANRVVPLERLVDDLWGESPPETVVPTVQVYVSRLRKVLPSGVVVTRPPGYMLAAESAAIDLARFERLVGEARGADAARTSVLLREALELWRGPALAEFDEEPFARLERERLEQLRLEAVEARIDADLALGRHTELVGELEALAALQPHRERLHAQLVLALYRSGRQADALAAYRHVRAALDELGLEPSRTLRQLEQRVLRQDSALDVASDRRLLLGGQVPLPAAFVPTSPFPFVGRERELTALRAALAVAESGEGGFVVVSGEAGAAEQIEDARLHHGTTTARWTWTLVIPNVQPSESESR